MHAEFRRSRRGDHQRRHGPWPSRGRDRRLPRSSLRRAPGRALRFAPPEPAVAWTDVLEADRFAPVASQNPSMLEQMLGGDEAAWSEDCLYLNVFTPACDGGARPVMVWIHGGGFLTGTGSIPWYDGTGLARRDAVIVTVNYRLGVFGFLHLEDIAPGFDQAGNAGLLDQVAALEWVRDNIAAFGGDPANVTVFGESAGAMSIATLLAMPAAKGLFRRAILESGAGAHVHDADTATKMTEAFLAELGVDAAEAAALRELPAADLLAAQSRFTRTVPFQQGLPLQPVVDGRVLPERPTRAVAAGSAADVDLLIGTTLEEMKMFLLMEPSLAEMDEDRAGTSSDTIFVPKGRAEGEALATYRRGRPEDSAADIWSAILTDRTFRMPAVRLVEAQLAQRADVWMYLFAYRSPAFGGALGSCHALEIPFVWDNLDARGAEVFAGPPTAATRELARRMADAWVAFARDGVPAAPDLPGWPRYDTDRRATLWLEPERVEVVEDPMADERRLWQGVED
ncbi:MAG: carboxylesterase/lipase family protein [Acidimicrobiales bacterium]